MATEQLLNDGERRALGCPSHPMNVHEVARYLHPRITVSAEDINALFRGRFTDKAWVKNIGRYSDPADAATAGQNDERTIDMPDDLAAVWSRRLTRPDFAWRLDGDLWMLTPDGWDALHAPTVESPPMVPSKVQDVVDAEWKRVVHKHKPEKGSLGNKLLPEEFAHWFKLVADECERVWNARPKAPMAGGASGYSDAYEVNILNHENQKTSLATPDAITSTWYMALTTVQITDAMTGSTMTEANYTGYARKSVAAADMAVGSSPGGTSSNANAITFAACTGGTSTVTGSANCQALTVGLMKKWGDTASTVISTTQTPATFAVGAYVTSLA